jgi:hypothetical protein
LLNIISHYNVKYSIDSKKVSCNSEVEYYELFNDRYLYLKEIMDINIEDGAIETFYADVGPKEIPYNNYEINNVFDIDDEPQDMNPNFDDLLSGPPEPVENKMLHCRVKTASFVEWSIRKKVPLPKEFIEFNLPDDLAIIVDKFYAVDNIHRSVVNDTPDGDLSQIEDNYGDNKSELMIKYALVIGAYCNENNRDDYTPTFDDVVDYLAGVYGKNVVPDYWVKDILGYASDSMVNKNGRPKKVLDDAFRVGFSMRGWYDENNAISEPDFTTRYKRDLPKASVILRPKAWKLLMSYGTNGIM